MCIGETSQDSLHHIETIVISELANRELPAHQLAFKSNDDGITWAVLIPCDPTMPRFTVCRIHPCLMVLIEDQHARRQFRAMASVEDVMDFISTVVDQRREAIGVEARKSYTTH